MHTVFTWISILSGFAAAVLWLLSARVPLPGTITVGYGGVGGSVQQLGEALIRQSKWGAWAVAATALSVTCLAIATALGSI